MNVKTKKSKSTKQKQTHKDLTQGLGTHLFVKVPRPEDSEMTFVVFRVKLPPVTTSLNTQR